MIEKKLKKTETAPSDNSKLFNETKIRVEKGPETGQIKDFETLKKSPGFLLVYDKLSQKEQEEITQLIAKKTETASSNSYELFNETKRELKKKLTNNNFSIYE